MPLTPPTTYSRRLCFRMLSLLERGRNEGRYPLSLLEVAAVG